MLTDQHGIRRHRRNCLSLSQGHASTQCKAVSKAHWGALLREATAQLHFAFTCVELAAMPAPYTEEQARDRTAAALGSTSGMTLGMVMVELGSRQPRCLRKAVM